MILFMNDFQGGLGVQSWHNSTQGLLLVFVKLQDDLREPADATGLLGVEEPMPEAVRELQKRSLVGIESQSLAA